MIDLENNPSKGIDKERFDYAIQTSNFLAHNFNRYGRFTVDETWGPEGLLYLAESSYALNAMYEITQDTLYLEAVKSILEELKKSQKPSGGWALELGKQGDGISFTINDEIRRITSEIEDLPPTVAALKTIADYYLLSKDDSFLEMGRKAYSYLMDHWDQEYGSFLEKENNELMALRSNPRSYHIFSLLGIQSWSRVDPSAKDLLPVLIEFVKGTFESYDNETMPLVYGLHAALLVQLTDNSYQQTVIKPRIDEHLAFKSLFRIDEIRGGIGHRDGLRGIRKDEAHMRSAAGVAIAMKFFDLFTNTRTYRDSDLYSDITYWIQKMFGDGHYYEFEKVSDGSRWGYGSPGQYLPIWWIIGKF